MAGERKPISKQTRFTVFKRDRFACQYCGQSPPTVILELDHILPVAGGGDNSLSNLVTACIDCNRGKADIPLSNVPKSLAEDIARETERTEQIKAYGRLLNNERKRITREIREIGTYWYDKFCKHEKFVFGEERQGSLRDFLKRLPTADVYDAVDIAFGKLGVPADRYDHRWWKYFCGVCWKKIRDREVRRGY